MKDLFPPVFGFDKRTDISAGFIFNPQDVLLSNRLYVYDGGTAGRPFDFFTEKEALAYADQRIGKILFSKEQFDNYKQAVIYNQSTFSEPLVRLRVTEDSDIKSYIGVDNLESRLLAKYYAYTLASHLKKEKGYPENYTIPCVYYTTNTPDLLFKEYAEQEYELDCVEANLIYTNDELKNKKYQQGSFEFLLGVSKDHIPSLLNEEVNGVPLFLELFDKGYVHIFKFLMEKHDLDIKKVLDTLLKNYQDNANLMVSILYHALQSNDKVLARFIMEKVDFSRFTKDDNIQHSLLKIAFDKNFLDIAQDLLKFPFIDIEEKEEQKTLLLQESAHGILEKIQFLLDNGADINAVDDSIGSNALHYAAGYGHLNIVKFLLEEKHMALDYNNKHGATALSMAAANGKINVIKYLIENGANVNANSNINNSPLTYAVINNHIDVVKYLIEKGADVTIVDNYGRGLMQFALETNNLSIISYLLDHHASDDPDFNVLFQAAALGQVEVIKFLVEEKGMGINNTNASGINPLIVAASKGQIDVVKYLLEEQDADMNVTTKSGFTVLMYAVLAGHLDIVKYLIEKGMDVNLKGTANKLMSYAICSNNLEIVNYLLKQNSITHDHLSQTLVWARENKDSYDTPEAPFNEDILTVIKERMKEIQPTYNRRSRINRRDSP